MTTSIQQLRFVVLALVLLVGAPTVQLRAQTDPTGSDTAVVTPPTFALPRGVGTGAMPSMPAAPAAPAIPSESALVRELPSRDNTPLVTVDGRIMFFNSTRRGERPWGRIVQDSTRWDDDIYFRVRVDNSEREQWGEAVNLGPAINTGADDGIAAISPNGTRMYFVSMRPGWETSGGPFYVAELTGTTVSSVRGMGGGITKFFASRNRSRDFQVYGAAIDAYEQAFYFATTVHSKRGEQEIWISRRVGDEWADPVNLGTEVNAPGGSYSPFIAADGRTLYFSSGRGGGYGGDDIYRATIDSTGATAVMNLGPTINSDGDEAFFSIPASGERVYLSSTRGGTESLVAAPLEQWMRPGGVALLSGRVIDAETQSAVEATVQIEDLETDSVVYVGRTNGLDDRYSTVLRPGHTYGISISAPGYIFTSTRYAIEDSIDFLSLDRNFELERMDVNESFTLHNIFFEYNSAELSRESAAELKRLGSLLAERRRLRIEVGGHTDNIGSDDYNLDLSARRARAVREYLVRVCGIEPVRVMFKGYGARRPVATNDTDEGRQANRRVAFTIVSM